MGNEFPHPGKDVEIFQVIVGEFAGQDARPFSNGTTRVQDDRMAPQDLASSAVNEQLFIGKVFIPDFDFQSGGKVLQMLEQGGVGRIFGHGKSFHLEAKAL
jgi:hypothetical protein